MVDQGMDVPAIRNKPTVTGFGWLWEAFLELSTCRAVGMTAGPIPWTAVREYGIDQGLTVDETYAMNCVVRHLDRMWLDKVKEKAELNAKQSKTKAASPRGRRR